MGMRPSASPSISRQGSQALNGCEPMTGLLKKLRRASLKEKPWPANLLPACHHQLAWILLWSCVAVLGIVGLLAFDQKVTTRKAEPIISDPPQWLVADTLVIYVYSDTDPEYRGNLEFFVRHGMWERDGCDYLIIIQQDDTSNVTASQLPQLPSNARVVYHDNRCFDWGTFGWAIKTGVQNTERYKYFVFMNSSVRGPFLPAYWPASIHWSRILTSKLTASVKLVGSSISCEPAYMNGDLSNEVRQTPHVQSYLAATDQVGLKVLLNDANVFKCFSSLDEAIWHAEAGSSLAILNANYNLDCLMLRYQGIDWRQPDYRECNAGLNPYSEFSYDGISMHPLEVLFVKMKHFQLDLQWSAQQQAAKYQGWLEHQELSGEELSEVASSLTDCSRLGRTLAMQLRTRRCFNDSFYFERNKDLALVPGVDPWKHFVQYGQFEGRPHRFTCPDPLDTPEVAAATIEELLNRPLQAKAVSAAIRMPETVQAAAAMPDPL